MHRFLHIFIALIFFTSPVQATDFALEPYIGTTLYNTRVGSSQYYFGLPMIGGRIGVSGWGLMFGVDANYTPVFPISSSNNLIQNCISQKQMSEEDCYDRAGYQAYHVLNIGPTVNVSLPFIIDGYGSLFHTQALSRHYRLGGIGLKAGMSYFTIPFFSLNIEVQITYFSSCFDASLGARCNFEAQNIPQTLFTGIISVSMPIRTVL